MITIDKKSEGFTYASFKERIVSHANKLPLTSDHIYTPVQGKDKFDYTCQSGSTACVIEVKVRNLNSDQYPTAMIEADKYNWLLEAHKVSGIIPLYQCFYNNGQVLLFNLLNFSDIPFELERCPQHSATINKTYTQKAVKYLPVDKAENLNYTKIDEAQIRRLFNKKYCVQ